MTWLKDGSTFDGNFSPAEFSDEGLYRCDIFVPPASTFVDIMLYVVGKYSMSFTCLVVCSANCKHCMLLIQCM